MSGQTILREYLLSLGFKVDQTGARKFDNLMTGTAKSAGAAGLAVGGLGATVLALARQYANAMEKMYYASKRGGGTVEQLQAMEYAGAKVGLAAGQMTAAVTGMASKLRNNAGLVGLLKQLGVETKGRTPTQELMDLIDKTANMPYQKGASIAGLFGLDEATYQVMRQNRVEMRAAMEEQVALNKTLGADVNANAEAMAQWGKQVTELKAVFEGLKGAIATSLLEPMKEVASVTQSVMLDWAKILNGPNKKTRKQIDEDLAVAMGFTTRETVKLHGSEGLGKPWDEFKRNLIDKVYGPGAADKRLGKSEYSRHSPQALAALDADFKLKGGGGNASAGTGTAGNNGFASQAERYAAIEKMWGLTPGTLQTLRNLESADGKNMGSGKRNANGLGGIVGDFQMDSRARAAYGVTNPMDEADAAAEMFADLKKRYGTDAKAAAAWNGGHLAGVHGAGSAVNPAETGPFVEKFMKGIQQTNNITINGGGPGTAGAVKQGLAQANGDLVRNMKTVVQ